MIREKVGIRGIKSNKSFAEKIQILSAVRRFFCYREKFQMKKRGKKTIKCEKLNHMLLMI